MAFGRSAPRAAQQPDQLVPRRPAGGTGAGMAGPAPALRAEKPLSGLLGGPCRIIAFDQPTDWWLKPIARSCRSARIA